MVQDQRFWSKVDLHGPVPFHAPELGPCWVWLASKHKKGYGTFRWQGKVVKAHIWAYNNIVGLVPIELQLDHLCNNPSCVNPTHLEPVTSQENTRRGNSKVVHTKDNTHCAQGHEFTSENTYWFTNAKGYQCRQCRTCARKRNRRMKQGRANKLQTLTTRLSFLEEGME